MIRHLAITALMIATATTAALALDFPGDPRDMKTPILHGEMTPWLESIGEAHDHITVTTEGVSVEGRDIHLVKISQGVSDDPWRVFAIGVQHGNEHSGKDALLYMIHEIAREPALLADDIELYIVPMANPDGVEGDNRRNANDMDLNRDHVMLMEQETLILHRIQQRIRAHVVIDAHEYTRDGAHFVREGLKKWPLMTLGVANSPYMDKRLVDLGYTRLDEAFRHFEDSDVTFLEYLVGGPPPHVELRPSTPNVNDARNGLSVYGSIGFIVEAGIFRRVEDPQADFGPRVAAYREILWLLVNGGDRDSERKLIEAARSTGPPDFLPLNYFWGTTTSTNEIFQYPALDAETHEEIFVPTANYKQDLIIKGFVPRPLGYLVDASVADVYSALLERHAISYERLDTATSFEVEPVTLVRIENNSDPVYERYGGRQVMERQAPVERDFEAGAIHVPLSGDVDGRRAALLLEPMKLYGLYQYDIFYDTVDGDGVVPVYRMVRK